MIQKANLVVDGNELSYGQILQQTEAHHTWDECMNSFQYNLQKERVETFNTTNSRFKKGLLPL